MLRSLVIRDFVIVEKAELELGPGFTLLTGETGAGKSILVDALELLVGAKADASVVRQRAQKADLSAEFEISVNGDLNDWLSERELTGDPGCLLLRRTIDENGRSRCFINGHVATLAQLKGAGEFLVDIYGQHVHQSLLRAAAQRALLDAHANAELTARECIESHRVWKRLQALAREAQERFAQCEVERLDLEQKIGELGTLGVRAREWDDITAEHSRFSHGSSLLDGAHTALETLSESDAASLAQLGAVAARLRALSVHDGRLAPIVELLESAQAQTGQAARELRNYASRVDLDPVALRDIELRMETLHAAGRKYRVRPAELPELLEQLGTRLAELQLAADPGALLREVEVARQRFIDSASRLSVKRRGAALEMGKAVTGEMHKLALGGAQFAVTLRVLDEPGPFGAEEVEFEVAAHPSLPLRPLAKVASGGELSRISLAIQLVASVSSPVPTLVFDEVDSGIGGAVADTVGRSLKRLGRERQVLCVTHLPQVAAHGDSQWGVARTGSRNRVGVRVSNLDRSARVEELARMLGGSRVTATTRKHAAELLGD